MWLGPRERGGGGRWIGKEANPRGEEAKEGERRAVSGGERAQLMMKQGRVGVHAHYAFSSLAQYDVRVLKAGWSGRGG